MALPKVALVVHGSRSPDGQREYLELAQAVTERVSAQFFVDVQLCYLEIQQPYPEDIFPGQRVLYVPLLLNSGYHITRDLPGRIAHRDHDCTRPLGSDLDFFGPLLFNNYIRYKTQSTTKDSNDQELFLAYVYSRYPKAQQEQEELAHYLSQRCNRSVNTIPIYFRNFITRINSIPEGSYLFANILVSGEYSQHWLARDLIVSEPLGSYAQVRDKIVSLIVAALDNDDQQ